MTSIDPAFTPVLTHLTAAGQTAAPRSLRRLVERLPSDETTPKWHSDWGWANFERLTLLMINEYRLKRVCEIGGGRHPAFLSAAGDSGFELIVNDIDANELALLPPGVQVAAFDIAGDLSRRADLAGAFDLVTSRMVFEHVDGVERAWRNTWRILAPGGVAIAFFPTLYAWPFVLNKLIPDPVAKRIVELVFSHRRAAGEIPVFPALYDQCFGSETRLRRMLEPIGFSEIHVQPFWGHRYLERLPVVREVETAMNRLFAWLDWRFFTTYAYVIVRK
jgi:SAM-dependent methyltransferase